uniref:Cytochrome b5 heme-binding domain-containing protein n=1 Tax=Globodera pallida TaxID=36090 RepID=A0A183CLI4_GLOPA
MNQPSGSSVKEENTKAYEADAWACRKVRKNAQKHTSLSNVPIIEKLDPDQLDVEREECQQMIAHQKCSFGTLTKDGELFV